MAEPPDVIWQQFCKNSDSNTGKKIMKKYETDPVEIGYPPEKYFWYTEGTYFMRQLINSKGHQL